jgi:hypothetical protein
MLKLEKRSREGLINVIIRDKESLLTKPFLQALAIAVCIHLALILLFHVTPFKITSDTVLPPTAAQAANISTESVLAELGSTLQNIHGLPPIPLSQPELMQHPTFLAVRPIVYMETHHQNEKSFTQIEQQIYQPEFIPTVYHAPQNPFQIAISGNLGEHELLAMETFSFPLLKTGSKRVMYSVLVEGKTGKVFWFEPLQQALDPSIDNLAEKILRQMRFAADPKEIAISGRIEMQFNEVP